MAGDDLERALWGFTVAEVVALVVLLWLLWGSVFWGTGALSWLSRRVRVAAIVLIAVQLLIPILVFVDLRRRFDDPSYMWVHVAAMPALNVFGLVGYLEERRRTGDG